MALSFRTCLTSDHLGSNIYTGLLVWNFENGIPLSILYIIFSTHFDTLSYWSTVSTYMNIFMPYIGIANMDGLSTFIMVLSLWIMVPMSHVRGDQCIMVSESVKLSMWSRKKQLLIHCGYNWDSCFIWQAIIFNAAQHCLDVILLFPCHKMCLMSYVHIIKAVTGIWQGVLIN